MENHEPIIEPKNKSNKGLVATLVIVIILAIAAVGGTWYYMNNKAKKDKKVQEEQIQQLQKQIDDLKSQVATKTTTSQTKSYTTKYDKLKFNYPSNWTLTDNSEATTQDQLGTGLPGMDKITITSSDGFSIALRDGSYGIGGSCGDCTVLGSENIDILGKSYKLEYQSAPGGGVNIYAYNNNGGLRSKNLITKSGDPANLEITGQYKSGNKTLAQLQSDPNVQAYKNFLQSLSY